MCGAYCVHLETNYVASWSTKWVSVCHCMVFIFCLCGLYFLFVNVYIYLQNYGVRVVLGVRALG